MQERKDSCLNTKLSEIIVSTLYIPEEQVVNELKMSDVETWDSLQHMNLIAALEKEFGVEFTFDEIVSMQNLAEIRRVLRTKGVEA